MIKREQILTTAKAELGTTESPADSNLQKYGVWYGANGVRWCGIFVSWVYAHAGCPLGHIDSDNGYASCQDAYDHFKKNGELTTSPQPGDIVFYDWNKDGHTEHTGIFAGWTGPEKVFFMAYEGNTSLSNQSNGGEVMKRRRGKSVVLGFVSPKVLQG